MDMTITPSRQPVLPDMKELLTSLPQTITIVSGSTVEQIMVQSDGMRTYTLGQNGNHATDIDDTEMWNVPLDDIHRAEIMAHISEIMARLDHDVNYDWHPIEDRGAQITFSPIGNRAPLELKKTYDPDRKKREALMAAVPFTSADLVVKIGGSTSLDYIHKDRHKGANVQKLIDHMGWNSDECIYFGDGLYPGGNDEAVIGVIETVLVEDHVDTYRRLREMFG